jgi:eukaryotic-like serine/threonine-protein kinase
MDVSSMSADDPNPNSALDTSLLAGQLIGGQYRVSHMLGEGGMAVVWAGTNERTGKRVALKVIRPDFMSTAEAAAFLRSEGLAASRVNHPNVVTVFDVIEHEGMACIVMELLHGLPLGTYIFRSGPLSLREATSILLPAMRGVAAAHAQGVIHRDLKPQNVFLCIDPDGRMLTTKVLDFGVSVMMDWAKVHATDTLSDLVGTPAYMAPEFVEGSKIIDERVDVYGFGLLFYEALTGRVPYPGEANTEVFRKVVSEPLVPMRELRSDLPPGMVGIVDKATAKRPEKRFVSLNQMASEIEDLMMHATLRAPAGTPVAGVQASGLSYTLSGPLSLAVPTRIGGESSGRHLATMLLGAQPQDRAVEEAVPGLESSAQPDHKPAVEPELQASSPDAAVPSGSSPPTVVRTRGARALFRIPREHPILTAASVAFVIAVGTFAVAGAGGGAKARTRPQSPQATHPTDVFVGPPPAARPEVSLTPLPPPPQGAVVTSPARAEKAPSKARFRSKRGDRPAPKVVRARPEPAKHPSPRAGTLRIGDF